MPLLSVERESHIIYTYFMCSFPSHLFFPIMFMLVELYNVVSHVETLNRYICCCLQIQLVFLCPSK